MWTYSTFIIIERLLLFLVIFQIALYVYVSCKKLKSVKNNQTLVVIVWMVHKWNIYYSSLNHYGGYGSFQSGFQGIPCKSCKLNNIDGK